MFIHSSIYSTKFCIHKTIHQFQFNASYLLCVYRPFAHLLVQLLLSSLALFLASLVSGHLLGHGWAGVSLVRSHLGVNAVFDGLSGELLLL